MSFLLSQLLSRQAERRPDAVALEADGEAMSYRDLDRLSDRLAAALAAHGVGRHDRVGIAVPKGPAAYASLFAALKLGACFVPLDRSAPAERTRYLLDDCGVSALVGTADILAPLLAEPPPSLRLVVEAGCARFAAAVGADGAPVQPGPAASVRAKSERLLPAPATGAGSGNARRQPALAAGGTAVGARASQAPAAAATRPALPRRLGWDEALAGAGATPPCAAIEDDLAYILYTSGSTGKPKGVMLSHRNALTFVDWAVPALGLRPADRVAGVAELHFDLSTFDTFASVAAGATLVPLPADALLRPRAVTEWMAASRISVWYSTPSTLVLLLTHGELGSRPLPALRRLLFAGEVFPVKHLRSLAAALPGAELYNLYGPTETNVCSWHRLADLPSGDGDGGALPIGRACANTELAALDEEGREAADGVEAELWVRGPSVMRGYWGDPERTQACLRLRRRSSGAEERWYRTGDFVVRDGAGRYHFRGRRDHMVKVRGFRVELGEVESALYGHPGVGELAVVAARGDDGCSLRAFVVPAGERAEVSAIALKRYLRARLPAYMVPAEVRCVAALPKTPSGKIDRVRLAATPPD
jgi:amino acid adenylation domain-containing protein